MEKEVNEILKYYIQYENQVLMKKAIIEVNKKDKEEIRKNEFRFLKENDLNDINKIKENYIELKNISICKEIKKQFSYLNKNELEEISNIIFKYNIDEDKENNFKKLIKIIKNNSKFNKEKLNNKIEKIATMLEENNISIAIKIFKEEYEKNIKMIPLFIFSCEIIENEIIPNDIDINIDAATYIIGKIKDRDASEINIEYEDELNQISRNIKNHIDGGNILHVLELAVSEFENVLDIEAEDIFKNEKFTNKICIYASDIYSQGIQNIKKDLLAINNLLKYNKELPNTLKKFLFGDNDKNNLNNIKYQKEYYGSYPSEYGVNENQYKIVNAVNDNELIAVQGPPGTGKTSLVKEIIANNISNRAMWLYNNWNKDWKEVRIGNSQENYFSFKEFIDEEKIIKSIVVSSKNREAISNIGDEINQEIAYFHESAKEYEITNEENKKEIANYKGVVCARLGKSLNKQDFEEFLYKVFIPYLQTADIEGNEEVNFIEAKKELEETINECKKAEEFIGKVKNNSKELIKKKNNSIKEKNNLNEKKKQYIKEENIQNLLKQKERELKNIEIILKDKNIRINQKESSIQKINENIKIYEEASKHIIKRIFNKEYRNIYKNKKMEDLIFELNNEILEKEDLQKEKGKILDNKVECEEKIQETKDMYIEVKNKKEKLKNKLDAIINEENNINKILEINQLLEIEICDINQKIDLMNCKKVRERKEKLFIKSLKLNEAYVIKNKKQIINNLELFLKNGKLCSRFFDPSDIYAEDKEKGIRALWNTLFICFPVVTTTLDSFCKSNFQLIPNLIDLLIIDEAGQVLPHNLITPLYRSKKAVIVGDIYQIPPIYTQVNINKELYKENIGRIFDNLRIEENSVQLIANKNTDILEENDVITLNEHYRCEKNIIDFSNKEIYNEKLKCYVKDNMNKPFYNNMVAFDIRGKKDSKYHKNSAEANACIRIVNNILNKWKDEKTKVKQEQIAIISPFKKQVELIKQILKNNNMDKIEVGTTHTFQGKQKDYVIFSTVIDEFSKKRLLNFIEEKPNLLNVAITRAKKQFILVGNFECYNQSRGYLNKLFNKIYKDGETYSVYLEIENSKIHEPEIIDILLGNKNIYNKDKVGKYINENMPLGILDGPENHYKFLKDIIKIAEKEIYICTPWISANVVNDEFIELIKGVIEKDKNIKITFGYSTKKSQTEDIKEIAQREKRNIDKEENYEKAIQLLKECLKENLKYQPPIHSKILVIDGKYMWIGSHNWLSNAGKSIYKRDEISNLTTDIEQVEYIKKKYFLDNN